MYVVLFYPLLSLCTSVLLHRVHHCDTIVSAIGHCGFIYLMVHIQIPSWLCLDGDDAHGLLLINVARLASRPKHFEGWRLVGRGSYFSKTRCADLGFGTSVTSDPWTEPGWKNEQSWITLTALRRTAAAGVKVLELLTWGKRCLEENRLVGGM